MNKIIYTHHSEFRLKQRSFTKIQIETAINNPDKILPSFKGRLLVSKKFKHKRLEVVYKKLNGDIIVITAYWLKEA